MAGNSESRNCFLKLCFDYYNWYVSYAIKKLFFSHMLKIMQRLLICPHKAKGFFLKIPQRPHCFWWTAAGGCISFMPVGVQRCPFFLLSSISGVRARLLDSNGDCFFLHRCRLHFPLSIAVIHLLMWFICFFGSKDNFLNKKYYTIFL